jgi:hypothetical protein
VIRGMGIGGNDAGIDWAAEFADEQCRYVNEDGQRCVRPRVHLDSGSEHRYPEPEGERDDQ